MPEALPNGEDTVSVDDSIRAAIESLEAVEPDESDPPPVEEPEEIEPVEEPVEDPVEEGGDGAEAVEAVEEEPKELEGVLPPASWSKEDREVFAKLEKPAQEIVARREQERDKFLLEKTREFAPVRQVMENHADYFQKVGIEPAHSIHYLIEAEKSLRFGTPKEKHDAFQKIARDYGIELPEAPSEETEEYVDPNVAAIERRIGERLKGIESQLTSRQQAEETNQQTAANQTAEAFFNELGAMDPKQHPEVRYVEKVMPRFQAMVAEERNGGLSLDVNGLKRLYSDAAWSLPDVREAMQSDAASLKREAKTVTKRVVKKSSSASGGSGGAAHSEDLPENESVRETVQRAQRQLEREHGALR